MITVFDACVFSEHKLILKQNKNYLKRWSSNHNNLISFPGYNYHQLQEHNISCLKLHTCKKKKKKPTLEGKTGKLQTAAAWKTSRPPRAH